MSAMGLELCDIPRIGTGEVQKEKYWEHRRLACVFREQNEGKMQSISGTPAHCRRANISLAPSIIPRPMRRKDTKHHRDFWILPPPVPRLNLAF